VGTVGNAGINYVSETSGTSIFFHASNSPVTLLTTGTSYDIAGVVADEYIIGASGVNSKMSVTIAGGGSTNNWLTRTVDLA
jgi:hypothetical protein